uniref:Uncharacterized protein n=1 Tax=Rhodosorus marinus TaxID=101924 RepID=A0A7S0G613_9RHOD|mmetsp:Transcript_4214/g.5991  ORF Transcript_4214/g.5991 Transcript_4214/m.5991 type:complete len:101 (+) Transcript_4214:313-615(+)
MPESPDATVNKEASGYFFSLYISSGRSIFFEQALHAARTLEHASVSPKQPQHVPSHRHSFVGAIKSQSISEGVCFNTDANSSEGFENSRMCAFLRSAIDG